MSQASIFVTPAEEAFATFIRSLEKKACCPIKAFLDVTNSKLAEILEILERHFAANLLGLAISGSGSTIMRHKSCKVLKKVSSSLSDTLR